MIKNNPARATSRSNPVGIVKRRAFLSHQMIFPAARFAKAAGVLRSQRSQSNLPTRLNNSP